MAARDNAFLQDLLLEHTVMEGCPLVWGEWR